MEAPREYVNRRRRARLRLSSLSEIPVPLVFGINKVPDTQEREREREREKRHDGELIPLGHERERIPPCDDIPDYLRSEL